MSAISITDVSKSYGSVSVLRGVDLEIESGTFAAVLGISGCGKSTLLRLLAGFDAIDAGAIEIGGTLVDDGSRHVSPNHRRVGYVPQEGALFPHLDVRANVAFGLPRGERGGGRADELIALVGLDGLQQRRPHELSGGQQQRVALARALATQPDVVLLDEPFTGLDRVSTDRLATRLAGLAADGRLVILATHDVLLPPDLIATAVTLRDGRLVGTEPGRAWAAALRAAVQGER
jgi:iron(III) transport system ATP-binding protein